MVYVGWILIALGLLFIALGLVIAARQALDKGTLESRGEAAGSSLKDLAEVLKALAGLPKSLMVALIGLLLVASGAMVIKDPELRFLGSGPAVEQKKT
jgi:uncharacterized membrane protein